ncbi:MAG TPA: PAS domain S-box protein [Gemmatimonadales bacterium]|nr:PAS domain S-box protein [Gemmatimonadales bacterium]
MSGRRPSGDTPLRRLEAKAVELEQANRDLATREARLRAILDTEPECVKIVDREGRLVEMNPAGLAMLEVESLEQARRQPLLDFVVPEHRGAFAELHRRVMQGETGTLEFEIQGHRGTRRWLETHAAPLRSPDGRVQCLLGITRDVTARKQAEEALRHSEARFAGLVQAIDGIVWEADARTFAFSFVSERAQRILGYPPAQWLEQPDFWANHLHPEDREPAIRFCQACTRRGEDHTIEYRMIAADGRVVWIRDIVTYVEEPGKPPLLRGIMLDVTERRQAELQIQRLNRVYAVLSGINQAIAREHDPQALFETACRIAVETGNFRMAWVGLLDPATQRVRPVAWAGAVGVYLERLTISLLEPSHHGGPTARALLSGHPAVCNDIAQDPAMAPWRAEALQHGYRASAAFPLRVKDRVVGTLNLYVAEAGFFDDEELRLLGDLAMDIAFALEVHERDLERREAEHALRASEERFRELTETIQEVFWISDPGKTRILYVSPAYEKVWGRTRESLYTSRQSWLDSIHPDDRERVLPVLAGPDPVGRYDEEYRILRPDGGVRWIRDQAFPVRGAGGAVERIVGVARDITDRKAAEEQLRQAQKMESVGRLAAGIAHDFNNILTVINAVADLALAELPDGALRNDLVTIREAGGRAAELTRQLLAFSRKQVLRPEVVNLNALVADAETLLRRLLGSDIRVRLHLAQDLAPVSVDPGQFHQVILNLAVNARDAMPQGGTLTIETRNLILDPRARPPASGISAGRYVVLAVTDTGVGMDAATRQRLFEPFFTTKEPGKGTGLGLATVHGIVKQSGGEIQVQSELDKGTTFTIYLPASESAPVLRARKVPAPCRGAECLLVVDDDPEVRRLTARLLERTGFRVQTAGNGPEALRTLESSQEPVHLLLADVMMPGMTGTELAEQVRRRYPGIRVLLTSGYTEAAPVQQGLWAGVAQFLNKPYTPDELTAKVRQVLDS